jgi:hypothetical protein
MMRAKHSNRLLSCCGCCAIEFVPPCKPLRTIVQHAKNELIVPQSAQVLASTQQFFSSVKWKHGHGLDSEAIGPPRTGDPIGTTCTLYVGVHSAKSYLCALSTP